MSIFLVADLILSLAKKIKDIFVDKGKRVWIWPLLSFLAISFILSTNLLTSQVRLEIGDVARYNIEAPQSMTVIDRLQTEKLQEEVIQKIPNVFEEDEKVLTEVHEELETFFSVFRKEINVDTVDALDAVDDVDTVNALDTVITDGVENGQEQLNPNNLNQPDAEKTINEFIIPYITAIQWPIDETSFNHLLSLENTELERLKVITQNILSLYLQQGVRSTHLEDVRKQISEEIKKMSISEQDKTTIILLTKNYLRPNLILNSEATKNRREEAKNSVEPVKRTVRKGEILVRHGRAVSGEDLQLLSELGLLKPNNGLINWIGITGIVFMLLVGSIIYLRIYHRPLLKNESMIIFLSLLPVVILALGKLASILPIIEPGYIIPVSVGSILVAVLFEPQAALFLTIVYSLLAMMLVGGGLPQLMVSIAGGIVGVYSVSKVTQRSDFVRAGLWVGLVSSLVIFTFSLTNNIIEPIKILQVSALGLLNGVVAGILINGFLPLLEGYMGMTSPMKLLELSNPNQPLLKRLLMEAPGTYHHSVIVGNLAEAAADKLGADSLLVRVGAYYHDVGKLKRPYFFSENMLGDANPHDMLNHSLSALIIKSHVKDGVELAKKYKVPEPIIDIIKQHHGTSVIYYFYQEALQKEKEDVDLSSYSYDGSKPQTKEAALVMLADIVEAAVRSRTEDRASPQRLEKLIHELIRDRLDQGQLDECNLTLRDLDQTEECFYKILTGIYHKRIEYPEAMEMRGDAINGNTHFNM